MTDASHQDGDPNAGPAGSSTAPGVLYFDPNPTTARLATAGLRLAGYVVHVASNKTDAVELCREHGPGGNKTISALLLDTASSPALSASVLKALVQVPGASDLPGVLLVSRANPTPFPGSEGLLSLRRPFTTPALLKVLREAVDKGPTTAAKPAQRSGNEVLARLELTLAEHFPDLDVDQSTLRALNASLVSLAETPSPASGVAVHASLDTTRFESLLAMLDDEAARGVLEIRNNAAVARLHLDRGRIRMAEAQNDREEDLRLGRFVVEAGFMEDGDLETVLKEPNPSAKVLGERLLDGGHLRRGELNRVLLNQALEIVCHVSSWTRGQASFSPTDDLHPLAKAAAGRAELRISDALLEALRRDQGRAEMGPHMPHVDDVYIRNDAEIARIGRDGFAREELGILECLNGRNSVKEVARKTRTGTFAVASILYRLDRARLAHRRRAPSTAGPS
ncbi:MAG: DUF4388 domain-containing protein [Myxococcota bacterium]